MFDLIVVNPPWINANPIFTQLEYDNAVYDPNHRFLSSAFRFASKRLFI
jgi:methylase of polypeptide subunit release factors